ncbi:MAG: GAF domain-containing protein [Rivularia sp. (in: Bacteria)]|nr:GAF domain-containing protein [Rivularia sp. MS3]
MDISATEFFEESNISSQQNRVEAKISLNYDEKQKALAGVISRIRESLDIETIFKTTVAEVRQLLDTDRVAVFRFYDEQEWEGEFICEDVVPEWDCALNAKIQDSCFSLGFADLYKQGRISAISDIYRGNFKDCYIQLLEKFQIRANIVAPLLEGDRLWGLLCIHQCSSTREWEQSEINFVSQIAENLGIALEHTNLRCQLKYEAELHKALNQVISGIRKSLDLNTIFTTTVTEVRQLLRADRVGVFRFYPEKWQGEFIYEDFSSNWDSLIENEVGADCFGEEFAEHYSQGKVRAVGDIYAADIHGDRIKILEKLQVRANMVAPLIKGEELWGLLCIHQCNAPRAWETSEIEFVEQISEHLGVALQQADYLQLVKAQSAQLSQAVERAKVAEWQKAIAAVVEKIRQSLNLEVIFSNTTSEVRELLDADRVVIYRFNDDWSGKFVSESVTEGWTRLIQEQRNQPELVENINECSVKDLSASPVVDTYLQDTRGGDFSQGEVYRVCNNIYDAGFDDCYINLLENYQAKAYIIVAIYLNDKLWGLLAVYQNSTMRTWHSEEVFFLTQIGTQLGVALQQAEFLQKTQQQAEELTKAAERQRALATTIDKIRQTLDIDNIFKATTQEVRQLLEVERVAIYRFYSDGSGEFVADSIVDGWAPLTNPQPVNEPLLLQATKAGKYPRNEVFVPITLGDKLWGLLVAYQNSQPRYWEDEETNLLAQVGIQLGVALQQTTTLVQLQQQAEKLSQAAERERKATQRERALAATVQKIRDSLDLNTIFNTTTKEIRRLLEADRVAIYRFRKDEVGEFVAESVGDDWTPVRRLVPVIVDDYLRSYRDEADTKSNILVVNNIYDINDSISNIKLLEKMQAKAYVITPVFKGAKLWGLLAAYQNSGSRDWQENEVDLLIQIATQLGVGLQQAELLEQTQSQKEKIEQTLKKLQNTQAQLIQSEKMAGLGQLVAGVAHEINNPVNFIYGNLSHIDNYVKDLSSILELYRNAYPHPESHIQEQATTIDLNYILEDLPKIVDSMQMGAERIRSLVISLRTFSRLDEAQMKPVDIHEGIESTLLILQHKIKQNDNNPGIQIVKEYGELPQVECHAAQLNQVFMNILSNAVDAIEIKFHKFDDKELPLIKICTNVVNEKYVSIRIFDNGCGIPQRILSRIFDPFFTTKEPGKGTGLGLSISYQIIVDKHAGKFECDSLVGKGSEFKIEIPIINLA